jgi:hypothetical protein
MNITLRTAGRAGLLAATLALATLTAGIAAAAEPPTAAAEPVAAAPAPVKPVTTFNILMVQFVDQAADAIWDAGVTPPKANCAWEQVEYHAIQLATTGTLLRVGGTGPLDAKWAATPRFGLLADRMSDYALDAAKAAREKNAKALKIAGDNLVANCETCHRNFKPDIPTQNITTRLSHANSKAAPKIECKDK